MEICKSFWRPDGTNRPAINRNHLRPRLASVCWGGTMKRRLRAWRRKSGALRSAAVSSAAGEDEDDVGLRVGRVHGRNDREEASGQSAEKRGEKLFHQEAFAIVSSASPCLPRRPSVTLTVSPLTPRSIGRVFVVIHFTCRCSTNGAALQPAGGVRLAVPLLNRPAAVRSPVKGLNQSPISGAVAPVMVSVKDWADF